MMKICSKCGEEKEEIKFRKGRNVCKLCISAYNKEYFKTYEVCKESKINSQKKYRDLNKPKIKIYLLKNKDRISVRMKKYQEENKERIQEYKKNHYEENKERIQEYHKKYYEDNKEYLNKKNKKYYEENTERINEINAEYRRSERGRMVRNVCWHRRRSRMKQVENSLTLEQWNKILDNQKNRCVICNKKFSAKLKPTMDHIIPLSKGGGLTFENVQALCRSCNGSKHAKLDYSNIITWVSV